MEKVNPTKQLLTDLRLIKAHTKYDMIGIEQVDPKFNRIESVQKFKYTVKMNTDDPENKVVSSIMGEITAGTLTFVESPYQNSEVFGTGRVAYLLNDDEKNYEGSLSGEPTGRNLEFLAAHYDKNLFKIIEPKWEKIVKKRCAKITEALKVKKPKHKFDRRYNMKGVVDDRVKVEVEHPEKVKEMVKTFNKALDKRDAVIDDLLSRLAVKEKQPTVKSVANSQEKSKEADADSKIKSNFAGE